MGSSRVSVGYHAKSNEILYLEPHPSPRLQMIRISSMCHTYYLHNRNENGKHRIHSFIHKHFGKRTSRCQNLFALTTADSTSKTERQYNSSSYVITLNSALICMQIFTITAHNRYLRTRPCSRMNA